MNMINPHTLQPSVRKFKHPKFPGGKLYVPVIGRRTRNVFKTKTEALIYVSKLHMRWCKRYDAIVKANETEEIPA